MNSYNENISTHAEEVKFNRFIQFAPWLFDFECNRPMSHSRFKNSIRLLNNNVGTFLLRTQSPTGCWQYKIFFTLK